MIKKLLKKFFYKFSNEYKKILIEKYLSESEDLYDLDNRQKILNQKDNHYSF